jgi:cathepsin C
MRSYDAKTGICENICNLQDLKDKYKVNDYGYIGGFYGNTNEVDMMKELRARGPIPGNIKVPPSFMFYKGGIFSNGGSDKDALDCKWSSSSLYKRKKYKELIEHSTLIVGYGVDEETNVKYWVVRNSWGTKWGEKGFFRVKRGVNEISIETMGDKLDIK